MLVTSAFPSNFPVVCPVTSEAGRPAASGLAL